MRHDRTHEVGTKCPGVVSGRGSYLLPAAPRLAFSLRSMRLSMVTSVSCWSILALRSCW